MSAVNHSNLKAFRWVKIMMIEKVEASRYIKGVLRAIDGHARDSVWCWPSNKTIGEYIGVSDRTAARHVKVAADGGWIQIKPQNGRSNHYCVNWGFVFEQLPIEEQRKVMERIMPGQPVKQSAPQTKPVPTAPAAPVKKPKTFGFPKGYSPSGLPKPNPVTSDRPFIGRKTKSKKRTRRWNKHLEPQDLKDPARIQAVFDHAVKLSIVGDNEDDRREVWALAVNCRKGDRPGAMFCNQIDAEDYSKITDKEEDQARSEIREYDRETGHVSTISFNTYQGGA